MLKRIYNAADGVLGLILLLMPLWPASVYAQPPDEYSVKAAFVYNILKYVEWPAAGGCRTSEGLRMGILGVDPFGNAFDNFRGKSVADCILEISGVSGGQSLDRYQAVYISSSEKAGLPGVLEKMKGMPVLTIGDTSGYMQAGVMINLIRREEKVGFEINLKAARDAGLKISSQLLKLAITVLE